MSSDMKTLKDGTRIWSRLNLIHREHGPAIEHPDGSKEWWLHGHTTRVDSTSPAARHAWLLHQVADSARHRRIARGDEPPSFQPITIDHDRYWLDSLNHLHKDGAPSAELSDGAKLYHSHGIGLHEELPGQPVNLTTRQHPSEKHSLPPLPNAFHD